MKISKKGALNLSVEAIIIFVLAFAMLAVGIFVTDQLRDIGSEGILTSRDILEQIGKTPTAEDPIVGVSESGLNIPPNDKTTINIGYYNSGRTTAEEATVIIDECKSSTTNVKISYAVDGEYPVTVVSSTDDVSPSSEEGFKAVISNNNLESGETYICKLEIVKESDPATVYESLTIFLNVIS